MQGGIYVILNTINNKRYIGSSKNILQRLRQHRHQLRHNIHCNKHLQSSFNKYGENIFIMSKIEFCDDLIEKEKYYIQLYNVLNPKYGYNKATNIVDTSGYKWTLESRIKLSNSKKGKKIHPNTLKALINSNKNRVYKKGRNFHPNGIPVACESNKKPVLQYDLYGNFIKEYDCIKSASYDGFNKHGISYCCKNKRDHSGGYIWKFKQTNIINLKITVTEKQVKIKNNFERIKRNLNNEFGELLENQEVDNQQPSINLND